MKNTYIRYSTLLILFLAFLSVTIAQQPEQFYFQREKLAPVAIKANLQNLRQQAVAKQWQFQVGYTAAMDMPITQLAGLKAPQNLEAEIQSQNQSAQQLMQFDEVEQAKFVKLYPNKLPHLLPPSPTATSLDWRKRGKVTPVRNQMNCGSCWAFATVGAYEGSYLIRNNTSLDVSEQAVLNCSGSGTCGGGWWAFNYMVSPGAPAEADYAYTANDKPCPSNLKNTYRAVAWGYVKNSSSIPSKAELKQALCTYGPLAVAVNVTPAFQAYTGGVFNENNNSGINHGVTLIGWDDAKNAWLIKNSWGTGWGSTCEYGSERGYMWISYNSNNIGYAAAWVRARSVFYILPANYEKLIIKPVFKPNQFKPIPIQPVPPKN